MLSRRPYRYVAIYTGLMVASMMAMVLGWMGMNRETRAGVPPAGGPTAQVIDGGLTPMGFHQYTTLSSSVDLSDGGTYTIPAGAHLALIQAEDQNVRWRDATYASGDTTDPTATVGMIIFAGDSLWYNGDLKAIELIEEAASATLNVSFYGR